MQLLLMPQEQIAPRKTARALGALERLLLCVRALVSFQMFEASERALAGGADMWPWFVCLWWREGRSCGLLRGLRLCSLHGSCAVSVSVWQVQFPKMCSLFPLLAPLEPLLELLEGPMVLGLVSADMLNCACRATSTLPRC